ncbi:hypothetical protein PHYC_03340 [Phycisphaerales bacterium]|nr:hypothetical protein PHYC_03340 [Phycisphaerales bacterium]
MYKFVCVLAAAVALVSGCAGSKAHRGSVNTAERARGLTVYRSDGTSSRWDAMVEACAGADAVFMGEAHGHPLGLPFASELWKDVLAKSPGAALSLEFFERDEQAKLDDFLKGVSTEEEFRKRAQRNEGNYPPGHEAMVEAAKEAGRPVIASNAPRPYVRLVRQKGFEALDTLTPEQRRLVRKPDELIGGHYHEEFVKLMSPMPGHGDTDKPEDPEKARERVEAMYRSQQTWDWTMAESVERGLAAGCRPVVHVVGSFHVNHEGGLVQVLKKMREGVRVVTVSVVDVEAPALRDEDKGRADFVVYVGPGKN